MFCPNCGIQHPDNACFCSKCGMKISRLKAYTDKEDIGGRKSISPVMFAGIIIGVILIVVLCIGIGAIVNREKVISTETQLKGETETNQQQYETKEEKSDRDVENIVVINGETTYLEGEYSKLRSIKTNGSLYLEGDFPALEMITITISENNPVFVCNTDMTFPKLKHLECGSIMIERNSGDTMIVESMFPALKRVLIEVENKHVDKDMLAILHSFEAMFKNGGISQFQAEISHTIEDLYGSWTDKNNTLSLSFLENGDVRISDKTGLIGVELMTYSKSGDHALEFNSKTDKIWKLLSLEVKYELFGDVLLLEILGEAFELYRG